MIGAPLKTIDLASEVKEWTDEAFLALPDDGHRYELVNGELVTMGNTGARHGYLSGKLMVLLGSVVYAQKLGILFDSGTAFTMKFGNKRSPDLSFMTNASMKPLASIPIGLIERSPDLAIEILSPSNTVDEIHNKIVEYFESGSQLVWLIHPEEKYVMIYHQPQPDQLKLSGDVLDREALIPGFSLPIDELFSEPEF